MIIEPKSSRGMCCSLLASMPEERIKQVEPSEELSCNQMSLQMMQLSAHSCGIHWQAATFKPCNDMSCFCNPRFCCEQQSLTLLGLQLKGHLMGAVDSSALVTFAINLQANACLSNAVRLQLMWCKTTSQTLSSGQDMRIFHCSSRSPLTWRSTLQWYCCRQGRRRTPRSLRPCTPPQTPGAACSVAPCQSMSPGWGYTPPHNERPPASSQDASLSDINALF